MITFSGLASGLDTGAIIDQLVSLERQQANDFEARKSQEQRAKAAVSDLAGQLSSLKSAAEDLDAASEIGATQGSSSDDALIGVTTSNAAVPGTYSMTVNALARTESTASDVLADTNGPGVAGTIDITVGTEAAVQVSYAAGSSLYDVAGLINDSGANVQASVLDLGGGAGYRLVVTSNASGTAGALTFAETGGNLGLTNPANEVVPAQDAQVTMNGVTVTRSNNTISDLLPGVTLTLKGETGTNPATQIVVERDAEATEEQIQGLVDAYNEIVDNLNSQLSFNGVDGAQGPLFADSTLQRLQRDLGSMVTKSHAHNGGTVSIGAVGIDLDRSGRLSINSADVTSMLENDPEALKNLLIGEDGQSGLIGDLDALVETYTRAGDGIFEIKKDGLDDRIDGYQDVIDSINDRADNLAVTLGRQFSALERTMIELQSQQDALAGLFVAG